MTSELGSVVVIGNVCVDLFVGSSGHWPSPGARLCVPGSGTPLIGGNGANVAIDLAALGVHTRLIATFGDDDAGRVIANGLDEAGITDRPKPRPVEGTTTALRTGLSLVFNDADGQSRFVHMFGLNSLLDAETIRDANASGTFKGARWIHVCGVGLLPGALDHEFCAALQEAKEASGAKVSLDVNLITPSDKGTALKHESLNGLLAVTDLFMPNEDELRQLFLRESPDSNEIRLRDPVDVQARETSRRYAQQALAGMPPGAWVAVKRGERGCLLFNRYGDISISPVKRGTLTGRLVDDDSPQSEPPVVDTTGAGDAWAAGLIRGRLAELPTPCAAILGSYCGAESVTAQGATTWAKKVRDDRGRLIELIVRLKNM